MALAAALHLLGVGGYRAGWLWTFAVLAASGGAVASALATHGRGLWTAAAVIIAAAVTGGLIERAPPSKGQLAERLDGLELPFFEETGQRTTGHSWCRPHCPRVVRIYDAPDTAPFAALHTVILALTRKDIDVVPRPGATKVTVRRDDMTLAVEARRSPAGDVTVVLDVRARRPA